MSVSIDKKVPLPNGTWRKYPWSKLRVGDSFVVKSRANGHTLCVQAMKTHKGKKFEAHTVAGVSRVWRTA